MLKVSNVETYGWEAAVRGMRNPMNSWDRSDSSVCPNSDGFEDCRSNTPSCPRNDENFSYPVFCIGQNDLDLMHRLLKAGPDHSKFMRYITVTMDITAPLYWWKEYDTYKVGTVANSTSTMHTLHKRGLTVDDFSTDGLCGFAEVSLHNTIYRINTLREDYDHTKDKKYWRQMIMLLPCCYNQTRTVQLNYAVLQNMYRSRKNHKLAEWHTFCDMIRELPYNELITGTEEEE